MSVIEYAVRYALKLGADEAFAAYRRSKVRMAEIENGEVVRVSSSIGEGMSVTIIKDRRIAVASVNEVKRDSAVKCVEKAYKLALAIRPNEHWKGLPEPKPLPRVEGLYDKRIADLQVEEVAEAAKLMLNAASEIGRNVVITNGEVGAWTVEVEVLSSVGHNAAERFTEFSAFAVAVAREAGEVSSMAIESDASRSLDVDVESIASKAAKKALDGLWAKPIPTFKGTLVMDHEFAAEVLLALAQAYSGYNVWRGSSPLAGRIGQQVASETLTIVDDGTLPGGLRSSSFDGEGSPTSRKTVVENGILKMFINNTFTARLLNAEPTGNAAGLLTVTPSNTIVKPGDERFEELVEGVNRGLLVTRFSGMIRYQDGVISGVAKQAFYIEDGEVKHPVVGCMVSANLYEMLKSITGLTREVKRTPYGVITPMLRADGVNFIGKR